MTEATGAARSVDAYASSFVAACHRVADQGLTPGSAGNVSLRVDDLVLITAAGAELGELLPEDVVVLSLTTGEVLSAPAKRPTSEVALHLGLLRRFTAAAIVHTHSPAATACAVARRNVPFISNESLAIRAAEIRVTSSYAPPGSGDLARLAADTFDIEPGSRAVLLANHGPVVMADTLSQAVTLAIQVEWLADVYQRACTLGQPQVIEPAYQLQIAQNYCSPYRPCISTER